jgi:hypothetical protein
MRWVKSPSATDSSTRTALRSGRTISCVMTTPSTVATAMAARITTTTIRDLSV